MPKGEALIAKLRSWWNRLFPPPALAQAFDRAQERRFPETHTVRLEDATYKVVSVRNDGLEATISSAVQKWHWHVGDFLLFVYRSGRSTRYRIDRIDRPGGMQFVDCTFAPRQSEAPPAFPDWFA